MGTSEVSSTEVPHEVFCPRPSVHQNLGQAAVDLTDALCVAALTHKQCKRDEAKLA